MASGAADVMGLSHHGGSSFHHDHDHGEEHGEEHYVEVVSVGNAGGQHAGGADGGGHDGHDGDDVILRRKSVSFPNLAGPQGTGPRAQPREKRTKLDTYARGHGGVQTWLCIDRTGNMVTVQMNKLATSRRMGVPLRDLRVLDPKLSGSYASAILCRERAMVVNLEQIKCIIGLDEVFVLDFGNVDVVPFVEQLERKLRAAHLAAAADDKTQDPAPFELRCLEVALEAVAKHLEGLMADLEASAHPALDALSHHVTIVNLERVRRIKSRMTRLKARVESIREILERYLNDDDDMLDMYLSSKAVIDERVHEMLEEQARSTAAGDDEEGPTEHAPPGGSPGAPPTPRGRGRTATLARHSQVLSADGRSESTRSKSSIESEVEEGIVDEVEMLLEAYFMQVDVMYNKLATLAEYIDDTEDFVNIKQDSQRNQLLIMQIVLTSATFCLAIVSCICSIFGMNLNNTHQSSYQDFLVVTWTSVIGCGIIFTGIVAFMHWAKLF